MEGTGVFIFSDGRRYEGDFMKGKFHGKGVMTYLDGKKYTGDFKLDMKDGLGVLEWKEGDRWKYDGPWLQDQPHGIAFLYNRKGEKRKGEWVNGK
jgi:hypothetical protein